MEFDYMPTGEQIQYIESLRDKCVWCGLPRVNGRSHLWPGDCIRELSKKLEALDGTYTSSYRSEGEGL